MSNGECDLHPQEHPIVDKLLHLDDVQSFEYGILDLVGIGHEFLGTVFFHFFFNWLARKYSLFPGFHHICVHELFLC